jgi:hypothetical protein
MVLSTAKLVINRGSIACGTRAASDCGILAIISVKECQEPFTEALQRLEIYLIDNRLRLIHLALSITQLLEGHLK